MHFVIVFFHEVEKNDCLNDENPVFPIWLSLLPLLIWRKKKKNKQYDYQMYCWMEIANIYILKNKNTHSNSLFGLQNKTFKCQSIKLNKNTKQLDGRKKLAPKKKTECIIANVDEKYWIFEVQV